MFHCDSNTVLTVAEWVAYESNAPAEIRKAAVAVLVANQDKRSWIRKSGTEEYVYITLEDLRVIHANAKSLQHIAAIKKIRELTGWGLYDAKMAYDNRSFSDMPPFISLDNTPFA